jgi:hypothetical protein
MKRLVALVVSLSSIASVACTIGETRYEKLYLPIRETQEGPRVCGTDDWATVDLSKLEECGKGQGHCYPGKKFSHADAFEKCEKAGEVCVGDNVLKAAGKPIKKCTSIAGIGNKGACLNIDLIPEMKKRGSGALKQDVCDEHQVCAPCTDPEHDNAPTGYCEEFGVHEKDCKGGAAAEEEICCHGMGTCLSPDGVPEDARSDLESESCSGGKLCAPASMVSGQPMKCTILGFDGVCLDTCFARMLVSTTTLTRTDCQVTEVCMPCAVGKGMMPGCE